MMRGGDPALAKVLRELDAQRAIIHPIQTHYEAYSRLEDLLEDLRLSGPLESDGYLVKVAATAIRALKDTGRYGCVACFHRTCNEHETKENP